MFRDLIELGVVEIERRLKDFWENASCPRCEHNTVQTGSRRKIKHFDSGV